MKKIIFVNNNLETGGVQTSLKNLLDEIRDLYDVTLLLFHAKPEQIESLPKNVKVITVNSPFKHFGMSSFDAKGKPFLYLARAFWVTLAKWFGRSFIIKLMLPFQKKFKGYDCAISFLHEGRPNQVYGGCNEFVLKKVEAKQKIGWLHCDFGLCGADIDKSRKIYEQFDSIVACSDGARAAFLKCLPEFENKTISIRNCNDYEKIKRLSQPAFDYKNDAFNIVTVARLSKEMGFDRALKAIKSCKREGFNIQYHIVGAGDQAQKLKALSKELDLENTVTFYGNQQNPYPFIAGADLLLLTSYHEAAPMVFDEAASLNVPVLATETTSTKEMITDSNAGIVCENSDKAISDALLNVFQNKELLGKIKEDLKSKNFTNNEKLVKFAELVNKDNLKQ